MRRILMPYFIYKIDKSSGETQLQPLDCFNNFKEAKIAARKIRAHLDNDAITAKIIFADTQSDAEAKLSEKRSPPILKEWEK